MEAVVWNENGDHPEDGAKEIEGEVIRYYRHPQIPDDQACAHCHHLMHAHGWIDENDRVVCPGDAIVTAKDGQHYPIKPDAFEALLG